MKRLKLFLMLAVAVFTLASCGDDDEKTLYQNLVQGSYEGWTSAAFQYSQEPMENDGDKITITPTGENLVKVEYVGQTWGTATFENVQVAESAGNYIFAETEGTILMAMAGRPAASYPATLKNFSISKNKQEYSAVIETAVMGGTVLTFKNGKAPVRE